MLELSEIEMGDNKTPNMSQLEGEIQINVAKFSFLKGNQFKRRRANVLATATCTLSLLIYFVSWFMTIETLFSTPDYILGLKHKGCGLVSSGDPAKCP